MTTKTIWVRADLPGEYEERKSIVSSALEAGFSNVMSSVVGRVRKKGTYFKMFVLSHNTLRGGAGGSVLNAELACAKKLL